MISDPPKNSSFGLSASVYVPTEYSLTEGQIEAFILACICIVATVGNVSFWCVICSDRTLRTTSNALILCLSMADILVSVVNMPLTIVTILNHDWIFAVGVCIALGFLNMVTFIASVMSLATIGINRYILVCQVTRFKTIFTQKKVAAIITGVWLLAALLAMPPLVGWGRYGYLPNQSFCFCQWRTSVSYTFFMVIVCFGGPCSVMSFSYFKILCNYRKSRRRINKLDDVSAVSKTRKSPVLERSLGTVEFMTKQRESRRKKKQEEEQRLTKSLLIVIFVFVICWLPFCVTMFWSIFMVDPVPRIPNVISLILGFFNSCCNPIIYGLMNHRFHQGFVRLFRCSCFDRDCRPRFENSEFSLSGIKKDNKRCG